MSLQHMYEQDLEAYMGCGYFLSLTALRLTFTSIWTKIKIHSKSPDRKGTYYSGLALANGSTCRKDPACIPKVWKILSRSVLPLWRVACKAWILSIWYAQWKCHLELSLTISSASSLLETYKSAFRWQQGGRRPSTRKRTSTVQIQKGSKEDCKSKAEPLGAKVQCQGDDHSNQDVQGGQMSLRSPRKYHCLQHEIQVTGKDTASSSS